MTVIKFIHPFWGTVWLGFDTLRYATATFMLKKACGYSIKIQLIYYLTWESKIEIFMFYLCFMVMNENDHKLLTSFIFIHDSWMIMNENEWCEWKWMKMNDNEW